MKSDTTTKPPAQPGIAPSRQANATSATGFPCNLLNKRPEDEMFIDSTTAISNNTNSVIETDSFNASQIILNTICIYKSNPKPLTLKP